jgi:hypothetical protein
VANSSPNEVEPGLVDDLAVSNTAGPADGVGLCLSGGGYRAML